jgi:HlyD family secretion protein
MAAQSESQTLETGAATVPGRDSTGVASPASTAGATVRVSQSPPQRSKPRDKRLMALLIAAAIIVVATVTTLVARLLIPLPTITGSGTIQAIEADVASKVPGRVTGLLVADGQTVHRGQAVARLDPIDQLRTLQQAQANLAAAHARVPQAGETQSLQASTVSAQVAAAVAAQTGAASSREAAAQALAAAQANLAASIASETDNVKDFQRANTLFAQGAVSAQSLDAARMAADSSRAQVKAAIAQRNAAQKQLAVADAALQQETAALAAAQANVASVSIAGYNVTLNAAEEQQARAALAEAQTQLQETVIRAPFNGVVMSHSVEAGDLIEAAAPVMTIMQSNTLYLLVYVTEPDLSRIAIGRHVDVSVDGIPNRTFNGVVAHIDDQAQYTPSNVQTKDQRAELVFGVKVDLYDTSGALKPGLPADATFSQP